MVTPDNRTIRATTLARSCALAEFSLLLNLFLAHSTHLLDYFHSQSMLHISHRFFRRQHMLPTDSLILATSHLDTIPRANHCHANVHTEDANIWVVLHTRDFNVLL